MMRKVYHRGKKNRLPYAFVLTQPGYYTGWLAIAYTFGTILTSYAWGRFADRIGRKPVMIIGMCASGITSVAFGLSTSFGFAVVSR